METILNIFPSDEAGRRFVVTCYQRFELTDPTATPIEKPLASRWLDGLLKQVVLTPGKSGVDVVLARLLCNIPASVRWRTSTWHLPSSASLASLAT